MNNYETWGRQVESALDEVIFLASKERERATLAALKLHNEDDKFNLLIAEAKVWDRVYEFTRAVKKTRVPRKDWDPA